MEYARLCEAYEQIESTSKRLEKTRIIAQLLASAGEDLEAIVLLLQGRLFPAAQKAEKIGVSSKLTLKALSRVSGIDQETLERAWSKKGDLGIVAQEHIKEKTQTTLFTESLTVSHVIVQLRKLARIEGQGSVETKVKIISELLSKSEPLEARFLTRTVLEELRIGIATGTMRDAILYAFFSEEAGIENEEIHNREAYNAMASTIQSAYDKCNDFAKVSIAARTGINEIKKISLTVGTPLKVMLGIKGSTVQDALESLGGELLLQYKYDGFRIQVHKKGDDVHLFTRRLEDVTPQFPDVVQRVRETIKAKQCILDGEIIGIDPETGKYLPFQHISQRIRRKYNIAEMTEKLPVDVRLFDVMLLEEEEYLEKSLAQRHQALQGIINTHERIGIAHTLITTDEKDGQAFYDAAIAAGEEGVFAKKLDSVYQPGVRVGNWIKIKNTMEPLDVVIIGGEWGEGKRSGWITSFYLAIQDEEGNLLEIGKVGTGLKELEEEGFSFPEITRMLEPLIEFQDGRYVRVKPDILIEVAYDEIQESPSYDSGFALRFPRILRNRTDERSVEDASTLEYVKQLYHTQ